MKLKMDGICKSFGSNEVLKSVGFSAGRRAKSVPCWAKTARANRR